MGKARNYLLWCISFSKQIAHDLGYKPVMKLSSKIIALQNIKKGKQLDMVQNSNQKVI